MTQAFPTPQEAARALIESRYPLNRRSGQFVGGTIYDPAPPSEKQLRWLSDRLKKAGLPPLTEGEGA